MVPPRKLFPRISSIIALKDRGFESISSSLKEWAVSLKAKDEGICSVTWTLIYRASLFGLKAREFHESCDGEGKSIVVVRADNGRVAIAYNDYGFSSTLGYTPNRNGFIVSINENGSCGAQYDRTVNVKGIWNAPSYGPIFYSDLVIDADCNVNEESWSELGVAHGEGVDPISLFGQKFFRVCDYEVFKIEIK
jgi:hypothetical protein